MMTRAPLLSHRWRTPTKDGESLIVPSLSELADAVEYNRAQAWPLDGWFADSSPNVIRNQARECLVKEASEFTRQYRDIDQLPEPSAPLILTGHQPELIHCGVWYKHFVLHHAAKNVKGIGIHLSIDHDVHRGSAIVIPSGSVDAPTTKSIPFDQTPHALPYEQSRVVDQSTWDTFGTRVSQALEPLVPQPLIKQFWPLVLANDDRRPSEAIASARHQLEGKAGLQTLELPLSRICKQTPFAWFVALLLSDFERFFQTYNDALQAYRVEHRLRSQHHPVPDLMKRDQWLELPLWTWNSNDPIRRRCYARRDGHRLLLSDAHASEYSIEQRMGAASQKGVSQLLQLQSQGVQLRPRALTTTLFARWMLGDLFIHGIGGAVYDRVTDEIARRWWQCQAPIIGVASATMQLPVKRPDVSSEDLKELDRRLRQLEFHPELFLSEPNPDAEKWIASKRHWIAQRLPPGTNLQRHQQITEANRALKKWTQPLKQNLLNERQSLESQIRKREILDSRELPFCVFPDHQMDVLLDRLRADALSG